MKLSDIRCKTCPYLDDPYHYHQDCMCRHPNLGMAGCIDYLPKTHPRWCPRAAEARRAVKEKGEAHE